MNQDIRTESKSKAMLEVHEEDSVSNSKEEECSGGYGNAGATNPTV